MKTVIVLAAILYVAYASTLREHNWRVVGGQNAVEGQFPYQISLRYNGQHICGGNILNQYWVLTAAHCVYNLVGNPQILSVVAGSTRLNSGGSAYRVIKVISHEGFSMNHVHNDVALLQIGSPIQYNVRVQPIALNTSPIGAGADVVLSGWGYTAYPGTTPNSLQYIYLKSITSQSCNNLHWQGQWTIDETQICTYTRYGEGICSGDSGGPLVYNGKVAGLASWVRPCAVGYPDVYTRVSAYVNWITRNMN